MLDHKFTYEVRQMNEKYQGIVISLNGSYLCEISAGKHSEEDATLLAKAIIDKLKPFPYTP